MIMGIARGEEAMTRQGSHIDTETKNTEREIKVENDFSEGNHIQEYNARLMQHYMMTKVKFMNYRNCLISVWCR